MRLKTYLDTQNISIPEFAGTIGVTVQAAHRYIKGERLPRLDVMDKITVVTRGEVQANDLVDSLIRKPADAA